ncbi:MAG: DNA polymerase III subunit beta [Anaerovorax sp.]
MKFTCKQQLLSKALSTVSKAVTTKTTMPLLKGILLNASNGVLTLSASDLDISIERIVEATIHEEGSLVLSAKLFSDVIRKLPNDMIQFEEKENNMVFIKCLSSEFIIVGQPADEFPDIGKIKEVKKISLEKEILNDMIKKTSFAASIEESKGIIVGSLIEMEKEHMSMVSLDGFRMAVAKEYVKNEEPKKIIIAARILNEISKIILETSESDTQIHMILDEKKAVFLLKDTKIFVRLLEGDFIKYKDIIPKNYNTRITANRKELQDSMERASLLSKEGKHNLVKFSISNNKLLITSRSEEGNVKEEIFIEKQGDDLDIGFNSKYVLDILKIVSDDEICMEFNSSISPCIFKPIEGDQYLYLVLPVRLASN